MPKTRTPLIERIWLKLEVNDDGCWIWTGYLDKEGYGRATSMAWETGKRHFRGVHAWVWEHINGPIPEGLEPDHLCRVKACCNPDHLEVVTHQVNAMRRSALILRCPAGHLYDEANTAIWNGHRACRRCRYLYKARRRKLLGRETVG